MGAWKLGPRHQSIAGDKMEARIRRLAIAPEAWNPHVHSKTRKPKQDIADQRFGLLTALWPAASAKGWTSRSQSRRPWLCKCACGNRKDVPERDLLDGVTRHCGCLSRQGNFTHGLSRTREYRIWGGMKERCYRPKRKGYECYGGRGIKMCDAWRDDFLCFYLDMGPAPPGLSIDRINNDGNYEPGNCRWATYTVQNNNKRPPYSVTEGHRQRGASL